MLKQITLHQDEPQVAPTFITQFAVMRDASDYVKVILDGQGADELFCGYIFTLSKYSRELWKSRKISTKIYALKLQVLMLYYWRKQFIPSIRECSKFIFRKLSGVSDKGKTHINKEEVQFTKEFTERTKDAKRPTFTGTLTDPLSSFSLELLTVKTLPALLRYGDRNSMAFSLETRLPMLDNRIVEYALALPPDYKVRGACWTKWVLRNLNDKILPKKVAWRRSNYGFPTPFSRWLRTGNNVDALKRVVEQFQSRGIIKPEIIETQYQNHIAKKADNSWALYRYITLELWYQIFIDDFIPHYAKSMKEK